MMRKLLIVAMMAATAIVPATAFAQHRGNRGPDRVRTVDPGSSEAPRQPQFQQRGESGDQQRPDREQQARAERTQQTARPAPVISSTNGEARQAFRGRQAVRNNNGARIDTNRSLFNGGSAFDRNRRTLDPNRSSIDTRSAFDRSGRDGYRGDRRGTESYRGNEQYGGQYNRSNGYDNRGGYANRNGWSRGWRSDNRYNWQGYRSANRSAYRLPRYYAPYGWDYGYRRFSVGVRLSNLLFDQNYWIEDPAYYRLPPAYEPYEWVRYYNDALLVDIRSSAVVDTVYDIFW